MSRYLVTGGCGFIGSNLVNALLKGGHEVRVLDDLSSGKRESIPDHVSFIEADVADRPKVSDAFDNVDGCFHLAADPSVSRSLEDYIGSHRTNLGGTISVLDSASRESKKRQVYVPVVYASSCAVYGSSGATPLSETSPADPLSSYGADKLSGEIHARMASTAYGVPSVGLRFFNVYGPGQLPASTYSGVLSIFCKKLIAGERVSIFGDGEQRRDFVFVEDVVNHIWQAMIRMPEISPRVYNVCTGRGISLLGVGRLIAKICNTSFDPIFAEERPGDIRFSVGDPQAGIAALGLAASISLEDGLVRTLDWLRA